MNFNKPKILFIDFTSFYGGGQKFILTASKLLNYNFYFAITSNKLYSNLDAEKSIIISNKIIDIFSSIRKINKLILANNIKFIILNGNRPIYFSFLISKKTFKIAYKHTSNNAFTNIISRIFGPILLNINYFFCSKIVLLYKNSKNEVYFNKSKINIIPNPIEIERFYKKNKIKVNNLPLQILTISRLDKNKGIDWLINAYHSIKLNTNLNVELTIAGDGPERVNLEKYILEKNIFGINFVGFVEDVSVLLEKADIFIFKRKIRIII